MTLPRVLSLLLLSLLLAAPVASVLTEEQRQKRREYARRHLEESENRPKLNHGRWTGHATPKEEMVKYYYKGERVYYDGKAHDFTKEAPPKEEENVAL